MSDLDGATEPGPENTYPAHAEQFAARWNAWDAQQREKWVQGLVKVDQRSYVCVIEGHRGVIARLRRERDALVARLAAVEALHHSDHVDADVVVHYWCAECGDDWPCATSRALRR